MPENHFASRETKVEYACGCTTTQIEAIRLPDEGVSSCAAHSAEVIRVTRWISYPNPGDLIESRVVSSYDEVGTFPTTRVTE